MFAGMAIMFGWRQTFVLIVTVITAGCAVVSGAEPLPPPAPVVERLPGVSVADVEPAALVFTPPRADDEASDAWIRFEYLRWWVKGAPLPAPLVTTGDAASQGVLGRAGTQVLFGGGPADFGGFSGGRISIGKWLDEEQNIALEGSGFMLEQRNARFNAASDATGAPRLAVPFFNQTTGLEDSFVLAQPGVSTGSIGIANLNQTLGFDGFMRFDPRGRGGSDRGRFDLLAGVQLLTLNEQLQMVDTSSAPLAGVFMHSDIFRARNSFLGVELGAGISRRWSFATLECEAKVGLGYNGQSLAIAGQPDLTYRQRPNGPSGQGFFAQGSNIGLYYGGSFGCVPQGQVRLTFGRSPRMRWTLGYDALYWTGVLRPGDQLDRSINITQIFGPLVGDARPQGRLTRSDFWAQGLSAGVQFGY